MRRFLTKLLLLFVVLATSACSVHNLDRDYRLRLWEQTMQDAAQERVDGNLPEAQRLYSDALVHAEIISTPARLYETLAGLAGVYLERNSVTKAVASYKRALKICESQKTTGPEQEMDRALLLCGLAEARQAQGELDAAQADLLEARDLLASKVPDENVFRLMQWGHSMVLLAGVCVAKQDLKTACNIYLELSDRLPFAFIETRDLKAILRGLVAAQKESIVEDEQRKLETLRKRVISCLRVHKASSNSPVEDLTRSWKGTSTMPASEACRLARFHTKSRDFESAERILRQAIERMKSGKEEWSPKNDAALKLALFGVLKKTNKNAEAEQLMVELTRQMLREPKAYDALDRAGAFGRLGSCLLERGSFDEASQLFERVLRIDTDELKRNHKDLASHCMLLGESLFGAGRVDESIEWFRKALKVPGLKSSVEARSKYRLALALTKQKRYGEATSYYKRALELLQDEDKDNFEADCRRAFEENKAKLKGLVQVKRVP